MKLDSFKIFLKTIEHKLYCSIEYEGILYHENIDLRFYTKKHALVQIPGSLLNWALSPDDKWLNQEVSRETYEVIYNELSNRIEIFFQDPFEFNKLGNTSDTISKFS